MKISLLEGYWTHSFLFLLSQIITSLMAYNNVVCYLWFRRSIQSGSQESKIKVSAGLHFFCWISEMMNFLAEALF